MVIGCYDFADGFDLPIAKFLKAFQYFLLYP